MDKNNLCESKNSKRLRLPYHWYGEMCYILEDEDWWELNLQEAISFRDSYMAKHLENKVNNVEDEDTHLMLRAYNFIVRTKRFLKIPITDWKYGLRKYREKRSIYNYLITDSYLMIIGEQPSKSLEISVYDKDSYASNLILNYLPSASDKQVFSDSMLEDYLDSLFIEMPYCEKC